MKKTNAVRLLESRGVAFELWNYESDPDDVSARAVAAKIWLAPEMIFKTCPAGRQNRVMLCLCVGDSELDLKALLPHRATISRDGPHEGDTAP
jgi:Cys-tRNA(Pro)/Cys-tRNA(Cys) deacylase